MRETIAARLGLPEIGSGELEIHETGDPAVFAHSCRLDGRGILAVHNFAGRPRSFAVRGFDRPLEAPGSLPSDQDYGAFDPSDARLGPYGYRWLLTEV